jgi:integration host factor subunit beta
MVKSELINQIANQIPALAIKDVENSVNVVLERISQALIHNQRIEIRGFGSFSLHHRPPRKAHNPKTGERVFTVAKYTPHFKPGKEMRERVNESRKRVPILEQDDEEDQND